MKANELRIGNLVGGPYEETEVDLDILIHLISKKEIQQKPYYSPIPLTEEWLIKFGFELIANNGFDWRHFSIDSKEPSKHITIRTDEGDNFFALFNHSECDKKELQFINRCEYVHQLQNLYFALTGEELTIKELA